MGHSELSRGVANVKGVDVLDGHMPVFFFLHGDIHTPTEEKYRSVSSCVFCAQRLPNCRAGDDCVSESKRVQPKSGLQRCRVQDNE